MRKFLFCFLLIFIGLSCTKEQQSLCGCSPVEGPSFSLIIKDQQNKDLLDPQSSSSYKHDKIKISFKVGEGFKSVNFAFRQPFFYGTNADNKFPFYQLYSFEMGVIRMRNIASEFYIDLGNGKIDTLSFDYDQQTMLPTNVKINNQTSVREESIPSQYVAIFYLLK